MTVCEELGCLEVYVAALAKEAFATATLPNSRMSTSNLYMSQNLGNPQDFSGSLSAES